MARKSPDPVGTGSAELCPESTSVAAASALSRRSAMRIGALAGCLLFVSNPAPAQERSGVVTGTVIDAVSGRPIARARVSVEPGARRVRTDARGQYRIPGLAIGTLRVSCSAAGYQPLRNLSVELRAGTTTRHICRLHPRSKPKQPEKARVNNSKQCLDEVGCLLADSPPSCCRKYSGGRSAKKSSGSYRKKSGGSRSKATSRSRRSASKRRAPSAKRRYRTANKPARVARSASARRTGHASTRAAIRASASALTNPTEHSREGYEKRDEQDFLSPRSTPLSTFSIDVDTASYSNVRRFINKERRLPPADAVKIEEMINYFTYSYPEPSGKRPFAVHTEVSVAPWNPRHRLVQIGIQGKRMPTTELPSSNLVFLIDVSGSMRSPDKLPLLKRSFALLVNELRPDDRVAIAVYAGAAGLVLPSTAGSDKQTILDAIERLYASGSTAGAEGIELAYQIARQHFIKGGNNRVILATDGDFNVGQSSDGELIRLIEQQRKSGVFLTVLGFGTGNYQDAKMEKLADRGNGNHAYIDTLAEARKVLVSEMGGSLFTIAKDVKVQVEFNPTRVKSYRLIGYDNRRLAARDFNDDKKDAGDLGAGHSVTAFYEVVPAPNAAANVVRATETQAESPAIAPAVDPLRYQARRETKAAHSGELMTIKLRYKSPNGRKSKLIQRSVADQSTPIEQASDHFRFAAAVAEFGLLMQGSKHQGQASYQRVLTAANASLGRDPGGYRRAFVAMVRAATSLGQPAQIATP